MRKHVDEAGSDCHPPGVNFIRGFGFRQITDGSDLIASDANIRSTWRAACTVINHSVTNDDVVTGALALPCANNRQKKKQQSGEQDFFVEHKFPSSHFVLS